MHESITTFFADRKAAWLKTKLKTTEDPDQQAAIQQEAEDKFSLPTWLPDAARRAAWLSMVSHPGKFSHPSAKTSSVIAQGQQANDGYLRTGNVDYELDVFGNAAAMDVYKFLTLPLNDGQTLLQHLERDSEEAKRLLTVPTANYDSLRSGFLTVKQSDDGNRTDGLVKQVYFPVDADYHLLSILTPAGMLTQTKSRIDAMRFSEATKQAKDSRRKNEHHADGFDDMLGLTVTLYGGTKPQNISVLNNQNAGRAYLLSSVPPIFEQRQVRLPTRHFFRNSLSARRFQDSFQTLDRLMRSGVNNMHVRDGIRHTLKYLIDAVLRLAFAIRATGPGWSQTEHYRDLPLAQRIWLDDAYLEQREQSEVWLDEVAGDFARWIIRTYEYLCKDSRTKLGDDEFHELAALAEQAVAADQEFFK
ncbi:type I-F CRISPR-associated protein Csy1 [Methylomonas sp. MED-D]|uniref:Type I-F CRISPR-associated protein Csy1 n=1 Tax=Methylomonas koyamae TaxID=702114 RepID=A0A177PE47_9GAMM|nr:MULTISPECIES: type I-F CRISPR-associated protein Csy1 [Methylomonas]MDT4331139.1 type I-F CRISPR-associated protein Csy1 [Methylomonas sp. MV1]OAI27679.1 type I-F CRISPR-associated protein Csy1 [Methylomonas koyamae]